MTFLQASIIIEKTIDVIYALNFEYDLMNKVMRVVKENNLKITHQKLELNCKFHISVRKKEANNIFEIFDNIFKLSIKKLV